MPGFVDLSGKRFGRLTLVRVAARAMRPSVSPDGKAHDTIWLCRCDCGSEKQVSRGNLKNGSTNSCGCFRNTQGGLSRKHPLWSRWNNMLERCNNQSSKDFENYGARGISVCKRWCSFPLFLEDMEATFFKGGTLERQNNDGNYEPGNVRWATPEEQAQNRRQTAFIDTPWGRMSRGDAARMAGVPVRNFITRVKLGWSMERLFDPANKGVLSKWSRRSR